MSEPVERRVLLEVDGVSKAFGSVVALNRATFDVHEDEIVGLVGDNGAGKSTLIKTLSGNFAPDRGTIRLDGEELHFSSPADARRAGIETVYQDLALCSNLDAAANFYIGRELTRRVLGINFLRRTDMDREADAVVREMGIRLPSVKEKVEYLSGGQRQAISLARFVAWGRKLILLDEPTAALGVRETEVALDLIGRLHREKHVSIILISHNLQHVFRVADRIVVLRHGEVVGIRETRRTTPDEVVGLITGAALMAKGPDRELPGPGQGDTEVRVP